MSIKHSSGIASVCASGVERSLGGTRSAQRHVARPRPDSSTLDPMQRPSAPRRWGP